jgi:SAM-dependent methyltransferase
VDRVLDIGRLRSHNKSAVRAGTARDRRKELLYDPNRGLPFADDAFDAVYAFRVLETVDDPLFLMEEIWRVSKAGAAIYIRVPHVSSPLTATKDPEGKRAFSSQYFEGFQPESLWENSRLKPRFYIDYVRLAHSPAQGWFQPRNPLRIIFSGMAEALANQHRGTQYKAERWWGPWLGGFEEVQVLLTVAKPETNPFVL